ncbi:hypothetical protein HaLaN_31316, partial [Haematococcus lacustris]
MPLHATRTIGCEQLRWSPPPLAAPLITIRPVFKSFTAIFAQGGAAHQSEASGLLGLMCTCAGAGGGAGRSGRLRLAAKEPQAPMRLDAPITPRWVQAASNCR